MGEWGQILLSYSDREEGVLIYGSSREYSCIMLACIGWGWIWNQLYIFGRRVGGVGGMAVLSDALIDQILMLN